MSDFKCQICSCTEFEEGPSCGLATNVSCARCGARYNITPCGVDFLGTATKPKVKIMLRGEALVLEEKEFETTQEAVDFVKSQPDSHPFGHKYLVYDESNILVLDG